jgi:hypothetical protein
MENEMPDHTMATQQEEGESAWKRIYLDNKGAFLILLAQVAGASMDAIARFLQQGGRGIHPFQVCISFFAFLWADSGYPSVNMLPLGYICTYERHVRTEYNIYVVDPSS